MLGLFSRAIFAQELEIQNIHAKGDVNSAAVTWNIRYDQVPDSGSLIIRYLESNLTKLNTDPDWKYTNPIEPQNT